MIQNEHLHLTQSLSYNVLITDPANPLNDVGVILLTKGCEFVAPYFSHAEPL